MNDYKIFSLISYKDNRGFFLENYSKIINEKLNVDFKQDNLSFSKKGTIRGLHYQWEKPMGKMVTIISGRIIDHIVDIRSDSPTFGTSYSFEISEDDRIALWVPPGYAHGFEALEDSYVHYKCSEFYNPDCEASINFFDKELNIDFRTNLSDVIISNRDKSAISFEEYKKDLKF
ncbi:MAG: dTDP-4-dehydrorhamnose 3,5-epimerase [Promethearchaeota archaeon]|jgi:dTDP-4-dehydrorhamnose 3,5-epimerase|nr:dTDP-4-dehydrorhamnose 3,5-epimerase [Asgard group archaeon]